MKILKEALLIDPEDVQRFNKLSGSEERVNFISNKIKDKLKNNISYIDTSNKDTNLMTDLIISISERGWDTNNNKYLDIAQQLNEPIPKEGFRLAAQLLEQSRESVSMNDWMLKANSYKPLFKAKAIAFLRSDQASDFGDNPAAAEDAVKEMSSEKDIKEYLSRWQTKSGESRSSSIPLIKRLLDLKEKDPEGKEVYKIGNNKLRKTISELRDVDSLTSDDVITLVQTLFGDTYNDILSRMKNSLHEALTEPELRIKWRALKDMLRDTRSKNAWQAEEDLQDFLDVLLKQDADGKAPTSSSERGEDGEKSGGKVVNKSPEGGRRLGSEIFKKHLKDEYGITSLRDTTPENELKKIVLKSSNYNNLQDKSAVDDYLDGKGNLTKILNKKYNSYQEMMGDLWYKATSSSRD